MKIDILTIFPEMFTGFLETSIIKRARDNGYIDIKVHNFRDYSTDKHKRVDDYPYGGGAGMSTKNKSYGCEIILYNDATISENYAEYGGGISAGALGGRGKSAKFIMLNGNVIDNTAIYEGGGICNYNDEKSSLDLRGGTISNNKAGNGGAGVSIQNLGTANTSQYLLEIAFYKDQNNKILLP